MQDGGDELDFLLHAFRQFLPFLVLPLGHFYAVEPRVNTPVGLLSREAFQLGEESELFADLHLLVEAAVFRQIAHALLQLRAHRPAEERDLTGIWHGDVDDHPDRGRFARAVRPQQAEDAPGFNLHRKLVDRHEIAVTFADPVN